MSAGVTRLPTHPCPVCGLALSAAGAFNGVEGPKVGDLTICAYCLSWLVYTAISDSGFAPQTRRFTDHEWRALSQDERDELDSKREHVRRAWSLKP